MKTFLISDNVDTVTGMRISGIEGLVVHEKEELLTALDTVSKDKEIGLLFITELLSSMFPEIITDIKTNWKRPLILEIPDRHGSGRRADFITSYINEAIGVKL